MNDLELPRRLTATAPGTAVHLVTLDDSGIMDEGLAGGYAALGLVAMILGTLR